MCKNHVRKRAVGGGAASESEPLATSSAEEPLAAADSAKPPPLARAVWSSGVPFFPPSERYWRIGGVWYDFASFVDRHPGGREVILLARDRFEDATYVFEAHHHDYARARKIIAKYAVADAGVVAALDVHAATYRLRRAPTGDAAHDQGRGAQVTDANALAVPTRLLGDDAFYSLLRQRVAAHLHAAGCAAGGPTWSCVTLFWACFAAWCCAGVLLYRHATLACAVAHGLAASLVGAFGHNWVHQPRYKLWAYLSLDTIGFSSDGWFREHILQHHMYTNTPWDNHFHGTDPFIKTDPTSPRNWLQAYVMPLAHPIILTFALPGNYIAHLTELLQGREKIRPTKLLFPLQIGLMVAAHGLRGALLVYASCATLGLWYFTLALMNHNACAHTGDVDGINKARDWGESQLHASADWACNLSFLPAGMYLWLNYHTVHHLFPRIDFSHHPAIQQLLIKTCAEKGVEYTTGQFGELWLSMVKSFGSAQSLGREILVYGGGI